MIIFTHANNCPARAQSTLGVDQIQNSSRSYRFRYNWLELFLLRTLVTFRLFQSFHAEAEKLTIACQILDYLVDISFLKIPNTNNYTFHIEKSNPDRKQKIRTVLSSRNFSRSSFSLSQAKSLSSSTIFPFSPPLSSSSGGGPNLSTSAPNVSENDEK